MNPSPARATLETIIIFIRPTGAFIFTRVVSIVVAAGVLVGGGELHAGSLAEQLAAEERPALAAASLAAGDAARGAVVFHTAHLTCTKCHVAGEGTSPLGPNLAGPRVGPEGPLAGAALAEHLVESLLEPSKSIRPEYRAVTILTTEGQTVSGLVARETADRIFLRDAAAGQEIEIARDDIDERTELAASLMPVGLVNLLVDRQQFLDLVKYLDEIARGGADRAAALRPDPALLAVAGPAEYERTIDHAGFLADWAEPKLAAEAFKRGEAIYGRVCANCHGTHAAPGSLPTALRFAEGKFKAGADPHAIYRTLTSGTGQMVAQSWMVPSQKYDVIHYIREAYLKDRNSSYYTAITTDYLAGLPTGTSRGPEPSKIEPWRLHDYGAFLAASIEVGNDGTNVARKGLAVRLDAGPGGIGRGRAWILYELDTLRAAAIWTGEGFIDWRGINFDGSHGTHPRVVGSVTAATPTLPGWADPATGSFADPRPLGRDGKSYGPLPHSHAQFKALHHAGDSIVLDYLVGNTRILETARLEAQAGESPPGGQPLVTRIWSVAPHDRELAVRVAAVGNGKATTAAALVGGVSAHARLESHDGFHVLVLPPSALPVTIGVVLAAGDEAAVSAAVARLPAVEPLETLIGRPARDPWPTPIDTRVVRGPDTGPFATDVLSPPVANPWNAQVRLSGIDFVAADNAVLSTWDGDVWTVRGLSDGGGKLSWKRIASGLFQPLGLKVIDGAIYVGCRDRIVILRDLDGDGCTDRYDTFNSDHHVTEHFHEFAMGLETDSVGNLLYAKSARHGLPAVVPHHGTLLQVSKDGAATEILARGFRAANGVCVEPDGTFFVTDQEGHWCPKNRINHVRRGGFYGNMFGFHDVTDSSDAAMEQPLAWLTNAFDRSPAELLRVPPDAWPPLAGQLLELSYGEGRIHLVLPQRIESTAEASPPAAAGPTAGAGLRLQGGLVALPMPDLSTGIMRGRFSPSDHALYTCGLFAWAGNKTSPGGFFRVRRTQAALQMPVELAAAADGFVVTFSAPLDREQAADPARWSCRSWRLARTEKYGSPHVDERGLKVAGVDVSSDGRTATVRLEGFGPMQCYGLTWRLTAADGSPVAGRIDGTVHAIPAKR